MAPVPPTCQPGTPLADFDAASAATASKLNYNLPASSAFVLRCFMPVNVPSTWLKSRPAADVTEVTSPAPSEPVPTPDPANPRVAVNVGDHLKNFVAEVDRKLLLNPDPEPDPYQVYDVASLLMRKLAGKYTGFSAFASMNARSDVTALASGQSTVFGTQSPAIDDLRLDASAPTPTRRTSATGATEAQTMVSQQNSIGIGYDADELIESFVAGKVPVVNRSLSGRESLRYVYPPPKSNSNNGEVSARLFVIEDYEIASFLGDYGAGRTVKTFSLLPGEKTTISVKTWRTSTVERTKGENVLDSFSAESSEQYESAIEDELKTSQEDQDAWAAGWSHKDAAAQQSSVGVSASMSGKIGPFGGSASASFNHAWQSSSENQSNGSTNAARKSTVDALRKGMDRHVNQSSSARKFEVNTETSEKTSSTEGTEESVIRELANINHSRVLNFVFRQLTQEYITLTSLKDVAIGGTWGIPGDGKEARLDTLSAFLAEYVKDEHVADVRRIVLNEMNNIYDHAGKRFSFLKLEKEQYQPLETEPAAPPVELRYYRRDPTLTNEYKGRVVQGVILDVASRILVTDALVVEALLGQGEALDCYNMRLQAAAADKAETANELSSASIAAINSMPEEARADAIAKISFPPANTLIG